MRHLQHYGHFLIKNNNKTNQKIHTQKLNQHLILLRFCIRWSRRKKQTCQNTTYLRLFTKHKSKQHAKHDLFLKVDIGENKDAPNTNYLRLFGAFLAKNERPQKRKTRPISEAGSRQQKNKAAATTTCLRRFWLKKGHKKRKTQTISGGCLLGGGDGSAAHFSIPLPLKPPLPFSVNLE